MWVGWCPVSSLLLWGGPLLLGSMPEREWWCYNNTEKPIFFLVVEGRVGGLGYAGVAVGQDWIHLSTVSVENV